VFLEVGSIKVKGLEYMKDLKNLEAFHFAMTRDKENFTIQQEVELIALIYSWCAQNLPQLKLIEAYYSQDKLIDYGCYDELLDGITPRFKGTSSLEAVQSKGSLPKANLPDLKELRFFGRIHDRHFFKKISSYKSLTKLQLFHFKVEDNLYKILDLVGTQLSSLDVEMHFVDVNYFRIFCSCPNLVNAKLLMDAEADSEFKELVDSSHVQHLEKVKFGYNEHKSWQMPAGLLSLIFQAPKIRMIDIRNFSLSKEDCVWLRDLEEGRFQRLQEVNFLDLTLEPGCTLDDFALTVKFLVCGAPKLQHFRLFLGIDYANFIDYNEHWCAELPDAIKYLDLLPFEWRVHSLPPL